MEQNFLDNTRSLFNYYKKLGDKTFEQVSDEGLEITKYNKEIDPSTVEWWRQQSKEAQKILQPSSEDISISKLPQLFADAGSSMCERVYTRGNTFDPIFTTQICRD